MFKESFYKWTIKQKRRIDPIGDFARDVQLPSRDPSTGGEAPRAHAGYYQWVGYLMDNNGCDGAFRALDDAYSEYIKECWVGYDDMVKND